VAAPIVGTSTLAHLEDAVAALAVSLTSEEMQKIEEPYVPHRVLGFV
jgi:aryl-alcohol dehydrogenase-like predicted oxidoreductase